MKYIFLTYVNRSGSTFLANQLSKSKEICVCPEANILVELFLVQPHKKVGNNIRTLVNDQFLKNEEYKNWEIDVSVCAGIEEEMTNFECFSHILEAYKNKLNPNANTILFKSERLIEFYKNFDKLPLNKNKLYWIALVRDCRAVYNSQHNTCWPGTNKKMSSSPVRTARFWRSFVKQSKSLSENKNFLFLKFENLIKYNTEALANITRFVNIDRINRRNDTGDLYSRLSQNQKPIHKNINSPVLKKRINAWQSELPERDICYIESIAQNYLIELGYSLQPKQINLSIAIQARVIVFFDIFRKLIKKLKYKLRILRLGY